MSGLGIVHTSYSSFAIVTAKDPRKGDGLWLVLPRGPAKLRDQRAYDEETKTRSCTELACFCVLLLGVKFGFQLQECGSL